MGDPFSAAASTAGFLTLGIEICQGLVKFYRAWKSHSDDIQQDLERLEILQGTLGDLSEMIASVEELDGNTSKTLDRTRSCIRASLSAFKKLRDAVIGLEPIYQPAGVLDKVHNLRIRSMHIVNNEVLKKLRSAVADAQANLDSAVQLIQMQVHLSFTARLRFHLLGIFF